jgi:hypothetical protein
MFKRIVLAALLLLAMAVLSACGGSRPAAAPVQGNGKPVAQATKDEQVATSEPGNAAQSEKATPEPTETEAAGKPAARATGEDDSLSLASRDTGLDKLKSYSMSWKSEWNGTDSNGKAQKGNWDWTEEFESQPSSLHFIWKGIDTSSQSAGMNMELFQIGETTYMLSPESDGKVSCISMSSADQKGQLTKGMFSPTSLGSVSGAKYVGSETVNGIPTKHYKYGDTAQAVLALGKTAGEIWIAQDGGFVVKDILSWQGGRGLFGMDAQSKGDGKWTWELTNVNQPIGIKAPQNCAGNAAGLPVMADATEKSTFGDMITYKTASKIADVVAFYQKEMVAAGWQAQADNSGITEETATLSFSKNTDTANLLVSISDNVTNVTLSVSKK